MKCLPLRNTLQALSDLFFDMVNNSDESSGKTSKSLCSKLLINTVKRDISFVGASFELSSIPVLFQSVSLTGSRVLQQSGINTIKKVLSLTNICLYMNITNLLSINLLPKMEGFLYYMAQLKVPRH